MLNRNRFTPHKSFQKQLLLAAILLTISTSVIAATAVAMDVKVSDDNRILSFVEDSDICEQKGSPDTEECKPVKLLNEFICEVKWKKADNAFVCPSGVVEHRLTIVEPKTDT